MRMIRARSRSEKKEKERVNMSQITRNSKDPSGSESERSEQPVTKVVLTSPASELEIE